MHIRASERRVQMSKIVCDVCGSSYSESESHCPICGTAKPEEGKPVVETTAQEPSRRAGRYSKNGASKSAGGRTSDREKNAGNGQAPSNLAMIIIVAVLLLAIAITAVFVIIRLLPDDGGNDNTSGSTDSTASVSKEVPCTGIVLEIEANENLEFTELSPVTLGVKALPENTTEQIKLACLSSDESVVKAVVQADGTVLVTPIDSGTATVTITYRDYSVTVNVNCNIPIKLETNDGQTDYTITGKNPMDLLEKLKNAGRLDPSKLTCESANSDIIRVDGTKLVPVMNSNVGVKVTVRYEGVEEALELLIRVAGVKDTLYELSDADNDTTIDVGESFVLYVKDKDGKPVTEGITWTVSNDFNKCCTYVQTENGVKITGTASTKPYSGTYVLIYANYSYERDGETVNERLQCIIRVR